MRRVLLLILLILGAMPLVCVADQLQWIERGLADRAVAVLRNSPILISYCPLAANSGVEILRIGSIEIVSTTAPGLVEISVSGQRIATAPGPVPHDGMATLHCLASADIAPARGRVLTGIDLAYIYIPMGQGMFQCLGRWLNAPCFTPIDRLVLSHGRLSRVTP